MSILDFWPKTWIETFSSLFWIWLIDRQIKNIIFSFLKRRNKWNMQNAKDIISFQSVDASHQILRPSRLLPLWWWLFWFNLLYRFSFLAVKCGSCIGVCFWSSFCCQTWRIELNRWGCVRLFCCCRFSLQGWRLACELGHHQSFCLIPLLPGPCPQTKKSTL